MNIAHFFKNPFFITLSLKKLKLFFPEGKLLSNKWIGYIVKYSL